MMHNHMAQYTKLLINGSGIYLVWRFAYACLRITESSCIQADWSQSLPAARRAPSLRHHDNTLHARSKEKHRICCLPTLSSCTHGRICMPRSAVICSIRRLTRLAILLHYRRVRELSVPIINASGTTNLRILFHWVGTVSLASLVRHVWVTSPRY